MAFLGTTGSQAGEGELLHQRYYAVRLQDSRDRGGQMIDPNARESNTKMFAGWQVGSTFFRMS
jgi:hypothetical protein